MAWSPDFGLPHPTSAEKNLYLVQQTYHINVKDQGPAKPLAEGNPFIHLWLERWQRSLSRLLSTTHKWHRNHLASRIAKLETLLPGEKNCPGTFSLFPSGSGHCFPLLYIRVPVEGNRVPEWNGTTPMGPFLELSVLRVPV